MQTERRVAANPQTKPTDLGCESAERNAAHENGLQCIPDSALSFIHLLNVYLSVH